GGGGWVWWGGRGGPGPGGADRVGFLRDELPPRVEARDRSGKREGDQEAEQGEDRSFDGASGALDPLFHVPRAPAVADFEHRQGAEEETRGDDENDRREVHDAAFKTGLIPDEALFVAGRPEKASS